MSASSVSISGYCSGRGNELTFLSHLRDASIDDRIENKHMKSIRRRTKSYFRYKRHFRTTGSNVESERDKKEKMQNGHQLHQSRRLRRRKLSSAIFESTTDKNNYQQYLETHMWMSKRMVMSGNGNNNSKLTTWGYRLPLRHRCRGYESAIKAVKESCIFYDSSFLQTLQLRAKSSDAVIQLLNAFMDPNCEFLKMGYKVCEIDAVIHRRGQFPRQCLGPVTLCWAPTTSEDEYKVLWIWAHPAFSKTLLDELNQEHLSQFCPVSTQKDSIDGVFIQVMEPRLQRFSIRGSRAVQVLQQLINAGNKSEIEEGRIKNNQFCGSILQSEGVFRVWQNGYILGVEASDKRFFTDTVDKSLPQSMQRGDNDNKIYNPEHGLNAKKKERLSWHDFSSLAQSPLWMETHRKAAAEAFLPDHIINSWKHDRKGRANKLNSVETNSSISWVETSNLTLPSSSSLPLLLVCKQPGSERGKDIPFSGWDIIAPAKWGAYLANQLSLIGARVVGIEELDEIRQTFQLASFPCNYPDAPSGVAFWSNDASIMNQYHGSISKERRIKRKIKTDRQTYQEPLWAALFKNEDDMEAGDTQEGSDSQGDMVVIRNKEYILGFDFHASFLQGKIPDPLPTLPFQTMVSVILNPFSRGLPMFRAEIFAPTKHDYQAWLHHHVNATRQVLTPTGHGRLGEWRGVNIKNENSTSSNRILIGYITTFSVSRQALGHCNVSRLHESYRKGAHFLLSLESADNSAIRCAHNLVLFRNPFSQWLMPAKLTLCPTGITL